MASRAVAGEVMTSTRLDEIVEYRSSITRKTTWSTSTGAKTADVCVAYLAVPSASYASIVRVSGMVRGDVGAGASFQARLGYNSDADPTDTGTGVFTSVMQVVDLENTGASAEKRNGNMSGRFSLAADTAAWIRVVLYCSTGTFTLGTEVGDVISFDRVERFPAA